MAEEQIETDTYMQRMAAWEKELHHLYRSLYWEEGYDRLIDIMRSRWAARPDHMLELDRRRSADPYWYQSSSMVGMMLYVDNFSGTFSNMLARLDYLVELGITYLHIMPVFRMPESLNDGGYAVSDFTSIDPRFGNDSDFDAFTSACHQRGISVCLDFVLNHTSDEHAWALGAKEGDPKCQSRYFIFPDRTMPDAYEATVNEVFPVLAPGNFTYNTRMNSWVLTTFNHFQWDLNYRNADVFIDIVDALLQMANRGVDIFRFDAIPYIWKEWGTSCRNLPQVHTLLRMFRLIIEIVAPATIIKGEVVMAPRDVAPYFGSAEAPECHLLYNVGLMVQLWNSLATRDTRMLASLIEEMPDTIPEGACWVNYTRCHDDIGWGFDEDKARQLGYDPFLHRRFLISFYLGTFPGSFSRGSLYESDPRTLDARNCGTCASLCGLEKALEEHDEYQQELALKRIVLLHSFCMVANGIPVIYSGDEIALLNNYLYSQNIHTSYDSRFLHRGRFDWAIADQRTNMSLPGNQVYRRIHQFITSRRGHALLGSANKLYIAVTNDIGVLCMIVLPRKPIDQNSILVCLANFTELQKDVLVTTDSYSQLYEGEWTDLIEGKRIQIAGGSIIIGPYELMLLTRNTSYGR